MQRNIYQQTPRQRYRDFPNNMKNIFTDIYKNKKWKDNYGTDSGPGSSIECSKPYLDFLQEFCMSNNIKSILDLGCGDFNLMMHFNFNKIEYVGIDIVDYIIVKNQQLYGISNIKFKCESITEYKMDNHYDLIILKDVFQHLSINNIKKILGNINKNKHVIITNDYSDNNNNNDINDGGYSSIDLLKFPYNKMGQFVFEWQSCFFLKKSFKLL